MSINNTALRVFLISSRFLYFAVEVENMILLIYFFLLQQQPFYLNQEFREINIIPQVTYFSDTVSHSIDDIQEIYLNGGFIKSQGQDLGFSPGPYYYYVHYTLTNNSKSLAEIFCEIRNPHLNRVQLYYSEGNDFTNTIQTGDYFPFKQREIKSRFFVFETSLKPGEQKDFFLFADKYNESIKIPIIIRSRNDFIENSNIESSILGYYFGAILIILLGSIIISVISPRKLNLLFILYLLGFSLFTFSHTGFGFQFLWGRFPLFNSLSRSFFSMVSMVSMLVFAYYFFEMKSENNWIKKVHWTITGYITFNWILHIVYYTLIYFNHSSQYLINYKYLQAGVFIFPIFFLALIIYQLIHVNKLKYYLFLVSTLGMLCSVGVMMLGQIGLVKDHFVLENITLIGLIVDFTILAGILSSDLYYIKLNNQKLISSLDQAIADGAKNFLKGQQNERVRLAQEIHDGTGVQLSAIQMRLSSLKTENEGKRDQLLEELSLVSKDLRKFSHNLSSVVLEQYGLINAIEEMILSFEELYPNILFEFDYDRIEKLNQLNEKELYFILSELINNSIKHSRCNHIMLKIESIESSITITYMDNGIGIDWNINSKGLGLKSIEWRLNILNGKMKYIRENGFYGFCLQVPV